MPDSVSDWLEMHRLESLWVQAICNSIASGVVSVDLWSGAAPQGAEDIGLGRSEALNTLVIPALAAIVPEGELRQLVEKILWLEADTSQPSLPYTTDNGPGRRPEIHLPWRRRAEDLMWLSHEVSHAVQIQLSAGSFVPPLARETCAFIGELALIDKATSSDPLLGSQLAKVWNEENTLYLKKHGDALRLSLMDLGGEYDYQLNYPLARIAAYEIFERSASFAPGQLFRATENAMDLLALAELLSTTVMRPFSLPPMQIPESAHPSLTAYGILGAMALLDLNRVADNSHLPIGEYYPARRDHMLNRTAFLGVGKSRRPIGYATWHATNEGELTLDQYCVAPDRETEFQLILQQHVDIRSDVQKPKVINPVAEFFPC